MNRGPLLLQKLARSSIRRLLVRDAAAPRRVLGGALKGRKLWLNLRNDTQVWRGIYEQALQAWLVEVVKPGSVCLDVGAAEGHFSLLMAMLAGATGRVIAIEPGSRGSLLPRNMELNRDIERAPVEPIACCACSAADDGTIADGQPPRRAVDSILSELQIDRLDVVKIDVEGAEIDVLDGAFASLQRWRPHICVEVHSELLGRGVLHRLGTLGYKMREVRPPAHEHRPIAHNPMYLSTRNGEGRRF